MNISLYDVSVWVLPHLIAITFHEAAHGFVAWRLGDDTAKQLGRVSFNPLRHIDPFGTVILPMGSNATVYHITSVGAMLYACTSVGIYTSVTQGQSWTPLPSVNYAVFGLAASGSNLVIVSTFGLRYSTNNGGAWMDCGGTPTSLADGEIIAVDGKVYAIVPNQTGCYRSIDAGLTFSAYGTGLSAIDAISLEEFFADGTKLYTGAFTDIYSITATSTAVNTVKASGPAAYVFPTVFEERFTIVIPEHLGKRTLILFDAQ